jgi:hypothetical protein
MVPWSIGSAGFGLTCVGAFGLAGAAFRGAGFFIAFLAIGFFLFGFLATGFVGIGMVMPGMFMCWPTAGVAPLPIRAAIVIAANFTS